jgi:hypothetical protein
MLVGLTDFDLVGNVDDQNSIACCVFSFGSRLLLLLLP